MFILLLKRYLDFKVYLWLGSSILDYYAMRWAGHVARKGEERIVYKFLVENPEGKRRL
jgi:hypothetical protein